MGPNVFVACELAGLLAVSAGAAWRFSPAIGLIVLGSGVIVLTFLTLTVMGRRGDGPV